MSSSYKVLGILFILSGSQAVLLGALYKIQRWELPTIGGLTVNLLLAGLLISFAGIFLLLAARLMPPPFERMPLAESRIPDRRVKPPLRNDDLIV